MIISVDTGVLQEMAQLSIAGTDEIDRAVEIQSKVYIHDDWNCVERDAINDALIRIKEMQIRLAEIIRDFSSALCKASSDFSEAEAALPKSFSVVDQVAAEGLSVISDPTVHNDYNNSGIIDHSVIGDLASDISESAVIDDRLSSYTLTGINDPVRICDFDSIDFDLFNR